MYKNKFRKEKRDAFKKASRSMKMKRAIQKRRIVERAIYPSNCCA